MVDIYVYDQILEWNIRKMSKKFKIASKEKKKAPSTWLPNWYHFM